MHTVFFTFAILMGAGQEPAGKLVWPNVEPAEKFVPKIPLSPAEKTRIDADKEFTIGIMYDRQDRLAEALLSFRKVLKLEPKHLPTLKMAALVAAQLDKKDEAIDYSLRAIALDPKDADRLYIAG